MAPKTGNNSVYSRALHDFKRVHFINTLLFAVFANKRRLTRAFRWSAPNAPPQIAKQQFALKNSRTRAQAIKL